MKVVKKKIGAETCPNFPNTTIHTITDHEAMDLIDQDHHHHQISSQETAAEGDGEIDEEEEEEDNNGDGEEEEEEQYERPKLADGFYELENVRRKRVRKGQLQYLIKWRGWPETANTWEPLENLQTCCDVIDAFEESLRSGKKSTRGRKRKYGAGSIQLKKKQKHHSDNTASDSARPLSFSISDEPMPSSPTNDTSIANYPSIPHQHDGREQLNMPETTEQVVKSWPTSASSDIQEREECNELDMKINELKGTTSTNEVNTDKFSTHFPEENGQHTNGIAKVDRVESIQNNRRIGARRRKPSSVKRFKQELFLNNSNDSQNEMKRITVGTSCRVESNGADNSKNAFAITQIIKPISYSMSVTNNSQDVLVTFTAMNSDGKEVMVDNKYLKANNPLLLINFYEQHLRYSPTL